MNILIKSKIENKFSKIDLINFSKIFKKNKNIKKDLIINLLSIDKDSVNCFFKLIKMISKLDNINAKVHISDFKIINSLKKLIKFSNISWIFNLTQENFNIEFLLELYEWFQALNIDLKIKIEEDLIKNNLYNLSNLDIIFYNFNFIIDSKNIILTKNDINKLYEYFNTKFKIKSKEEDLKTKCYIIENEHIKQLEKYSEYTLKIKKHLIF